MLPSLVIFDCDGVLVDTEAAVNNVLLKYLHHSGYFITLEQCRRQFVGRPIRAIQAYVEAELGQALGESWAEEIHQETMRVLQKGVKAIAGVEDVIRFFQSVSVPFCVASSGLLSKMRLSLGGAGLLPYFEKTLFSAEQVKEGKPAPDLFLFAAENMGVSPDDCLVIEDSLPGVDAALAANMPVIAYGGDPHSDHEGLEQRGVLIVYEMADILKVI